MSVVIPHYNRASLLGESLESVLAQTVPPAEVIVVDDASRPEERARIEPWAARVRILDQPQNGGVAAARNAGLAAATSEWVAFLDSDDLWVPGKLERQLAHLAEHPTCDGVYTGLAVFYPGGREVVRDPLPPRLTLHDALIHNMIHVQTLIVRTRLLREIGGFDAALRVAEDDDLSIRLALAGARLDCLNEPLVRLRREDHGHLMSNWRKVIGWKAKVAWKHRVPLERELGRGATRRRVALTVRKAGWQVGGVTGRALRLLGYLGGGFDGSTD